MTKTYISNVTHVTGKASKGKTRTAEALRVKYGGYIYDADNLIATSHEIQLEMQHAQRTGTFLIVVSSHSNPFARKPLHPGFTIICK